MKKILVTGGFGFIGSTLVEILTQDKRNKIHVIDDMSTSPIDIADFLETNKNPKNLSFNIMTVNEFFSKKNIGHWDEIYHLASPVGPAGVLKHAGNMIREVVRDGYLIIDYCLKKKSKLLFVSSSEIYGGGQGGYCDETMPKIISAETSVRLEYAVAKLAVETAIINTVSKRNLKAVIVRPFNVAGKRQSIAGGFVLPRFIQQAHNGKPITVFAGGEGVRTFTSVKDIVKGITLAMEKGAYGEAYNIGNPKNKTKISELAKKVKKILKSKSDINYIDPKNIFGKYYKEASDKYPEVSKAQRELGFEPKIGLETIIWEARDEYLRQLSKGVLKDKI
jgi:UDP-glucose 4-epimerase